MTRPEEFSKIIGEYIARMEYPAVPKLLYDPIRYTMEDGGKRLRPLFVLAACGLFKDDISDSLPAAVAVEMFHNFTLLHDDIMDNAALRRGRPSVHKRWGNNVAILSGDELMIYSYRELARVAPAHLPAVLDFFNEAAVKVCEGQHYDMDFEGRENVKLAEHIAMIELKTASLFVGAVSMGARIGGAKEADVESLRRFALQFGVAFQMQDDLLDSYGDARLGKQVGGDILEGKKTYLKMVALGRASADDKAELSLIHKDLRFTPEEKIARVLELYDRYGVRAEVETEIERRFTAATDALNSLSASVPVERAEQFKAFALGQLGRKK
jgi:geranylgeranyl diphosphate synthase type II